jgi:hypothetical protein
VAGLALVLITNVALLSLMTLICSSLLGGQISNLLFLTILFTILESVLLLLLVVFFSLLTSPILATVVSVLIWILGHAVKESQSLTYVQNRSAFKVILKFYHLILPAFYKLNLKDFVIYQQSLPVSYIVSALSYGAFYSAFLFLLIVYIFNKKNLD